MCSVTKSCLTSWPHGLQHSRFLCPSPSPGVCPNPSPLHWWCHPTISSSFALFSSAFNLSQNWVFFNESALVIRWTQYWSFSFGISVSNEYSNSNWLISCKVDWFDLLEVQGISRVFPRTIVWKQQFFSTLPSLCSSSHSHESQLVLNSS